MSDDFIDIDLESIPDEGFPPIPETNPGMIIDSAEKTQKTGSKFPYIAVTMKALPGQTAEQFMNTHVYVNLSYHPNALWHMKLFLGALGIKSIKGLRPEEVARMLVGQRIRPTLTIEDNTKGRMVNKVNPPYHAFD